MDLALPIPADGSLNRSPFVGRLTELRTLTDAWHKAVSGERQLLFVSGEPGIGKTRLVTRLADSVGAEHGIVLLGRCDEEALIVYQPFVEALGGHLQKVPDDFSSPEVSSVITDLSRLLPELNTRKHVLEIAQPSDPEAERYRLFEAVVATMAAISELRPTLLILDDLQWADRASLLLLKYLVRAPRKARLLIVATYRDTDLRRGHPLTDLLADLRKDRLFQRTALNGLTLDELSTLVQAWVGATPSEAFVSALHMETEGNPFFAEEVLEHLLESLDEEASRPWNGDVFAGDFGIPDGLREVIGRRLSRLAVATNEMLVAAAVLGKDFDADVVQRLTNLEDDVLLNAIDEAVHSRLIREEGQSPRARYSFSHSLVRQTLYEELNLPRRQRFHLRAAEAIEAVHGTEQKLGGPAALATHYRNAGALADPDKAIGFSVQAAEAAARVFAWEEAVMHYEGALQVLDFSSPEDTRRIDLLLALGWTLMPPGETRRVIDTVAPEALTIAERANDRGRAAAACRLAMEAFSRAGARMMTLTREWKQWAVAYERYAEVDSTDRIRLDIDYAESFHMSGDESRAWQNRVAAVELARRLNARDEWLLALAFSMYYTQSPKLEAQRVELADQATMRGISGASPRTLATLYLYSAWSYWDWGQRDKAEGMFAQLRLLPATFRDPFVMEYAVFAEAATAAIEGRLEDTVAMAHEIVRVSDEIGCGVFGRMNAANIAFRALLHLGRPEEALQMLDLAWRAAGLAVEPPVNSARRALALAYAGREAEAAILLDEAMTERRILPEDDGGIATTDLMPLLETAALLRNIETTRVLYQRLKDVPSLVKIHGSTQTSVGRLLGDAAVLLGEPALALDHYEAAMESCLKISFRPEVAVLRLMLAELLLKHNPVDGRASRYLESAAEEFAGMDMAPWSARAAKLRSPRRPTFPDGLTGREIEVLRLLAQGKSNQEIADALTISPHTAGHHVGNILSKTGAANRTEAASYAFQHGFGV